MKTAKQQKRRIGQVGNHLPRQAGAITIVLGKHAETGIEPAAPFARFEQGDVEGRRPTAGALH
jgi:hypothetical protein